MFKVIRYTSRHLSNPWVHTVYATGMNSNDDLEFLFYTEDAVWKWDLADRYIPYKNEGAKVNG